MLPFTIGVIMSAAKGNPKPAKNLWNTISPKFLTSSKGRRNIRMMDISYRMTFNDNFHEGKDLGLDKCGIARVKLEVVGIGAKRYPDTKIVQAKTRERHQRAHSSDSGLQVGAFRQLEGARKCQARYASLYPGYTSVIKKLVSRNGMPLYRVWLTGFRSQHEIDVFKRHQANRV